MTRALLLISEEECAAAREQVARGVSPRKDYLALADALGADILDRSQVRENGAARRLDALLRRGAGHAWLAAKSVSDYDVIFSDGEHIGLPLGVLLSRRRYRGRHVMIGHSLSAWKKRLLAEWGRDGIDSLVVHSSGQLEFALETLQMDAAQVYLMPYQVDTEFWRPRETSDEMLLVSCGLEQRDYGTFMEAVRQLPVGVRIGAASHWSRNPNRLKGQRLPDNVTVGSYDYLELRELYEGSRAVVVPLRDVDFPAGITTILEAMAMAKAVIVTRTRGQRETVIGPLWSEGMTSWPADGPPPEASTGIYVPPGDVEALRSAILYLLARPELAAVLGGNGRRYVEDNASLERFVERLAAVIDPARAGADLARQ